MNSKNKRSLVERKRIACILLDEFKKKYPIYFKNPSLSNMPEPKLPDKMKNVNLSNKQMAQVPIDVLRKSVLCGTCLSDSSIQINAGYKNARIQNRHSSRQSTWFYWKWKVCLNQYVESDAAFQFQDPDGYQEISPVKDGEYLGKLKIATKAHPDLTALHTVICTKKGGKMVKTISRSWLNHMTDYFLMTVWCDDGSLYNGRQGQICFDAIPKKEQEVFLDYLKNVWEIEAYLVEADELMRTGEKRYRINIKDIDNLLRLLRIVAPLIPVKEMLYKVTFVPINNSGLLQRWASEIEGLVQPEFRDYISAEYKQIIQNYNQIN